MMTAFTAIAPHLRGAASESAVEIALADDAALMAAAKLEAVKVLACALVAILEGESEGNSVQARKITFRDEVQRFESNLIKSALKCTGGRQRRAARLLGMNVATLNLRIKRYGLNSREMELTEVSAS